VSAAKRNVRLGGARENVEKKEKVRKSAKHENKRTSLT